MNEIALLVDEQG